MLVVLTDGRLEWDASTSSFSNEFTTALSAEALKSFVSEPLWIDLSWIKSPKVECRSDNPEFRRAIAAISATIRGVDKDVLLGEDLQQRRRAMLQAYAAAATISILAIGLYFQRSAAEKQRDRALTQESRALAKISSQALVQGDPEAAALIALEGMPANALGQNQRPYSSEAAAAVYQAIIRNRETAVINNNGETLVSDFLSVSGRALTVTDNGNVSIWDTSSTVEAKWMRSLSDRITAADLSLSKTRLITSSSANAATVWAVTADGLQDIVSLQHEDPVISLTLLGEDGNRVAVVTGAEGSQSKLFLWNTETVPPTRVQILESARPIALFASPRRRMFVAGPIDGADGHAATITVWDASSPRPRLIGSRRTGTGSITSAAFDDVEKRLLVARAGEVLQLYNVDARLSSREHFPNHDIRNIVLAAAFNPVGTVLVTGGQDGSLRAHSFNQRSPTTHTVLASHKASISSISFGNSSTTPLLITSSDSTATVWSLENVDPGAEQSPTFTVKHLGSLLSGAFNQSGDRFITSARDGTSRVWTTEPSLVVSLHPGRTGARPAVSDQQYFSLTSDGRYATGSGVATPDTFHIWETLTGKVTATISTTPLSQPTKSGLCFGSEAVSASSENETVIVFECFDNDAKPPTQTVHVVRLRDGKLAEAIALPRNAQLGSQRQNLSADGSTLVTSTAAGFRRGDPRGSLLLWNTKELSKPPRSVASNMTKNDLFVLSPDGHLLFTSETDWDGNFVRACVWDVVRAPTDCVALSSLQTRLTSAAFSPDSMTVAVGDAEGNIRVVNAARPHLNGMRTKIPFGPVGALRFSSGDRTLIISSADDGHPDADAVFVWRLRDERSYLEALPGSRGDIRGAAQADYEILATLGSDGDRLLIWDLSTDYPVVSSGPEIEGASSFGFVHGSHSLIVGPFKKDGLDQIQMRLIPFPDFRTSLRDFALKQLRRCLTRVERIKYGLDVTAGPMPGNEIVLSNGNEMCRE